MANVQANPPISGNTCDDSHNGVNPGTTNSWNTLKKLIEDNVFNCESCGLFFKTAVFSVYGIGTVCQSCVTRNKWQGERLKFFDAALHDLPVVPCSNAADGCNLQVLPEDLQLHLEDCKCRPVKCISPGCTWRNKQDDLAKHFQGAHPADVIDEKTIFDLDIAQESFVVAKLVVKKAGEYFVVIRRESNSDRVLYHTYRAETGNVHTVSVRHFCDSTEDYRKQIETEQLNMIDKTDGALNTISLNLLKEITKGQKGVSVTVNVTESKFEKLLRCSGCRETMRRPVYQCERDHGVCESCSSRLLQCPVCQKELDGETRNPTLEALVSDVYYRCVNQQIGCQARVLGDKIHRHESMCPRNPRCPVPGCSFKENSNELVIKHIKCKHGATCIVGNTLKFISYHEDWKLCSKNTSEPRHYIFFDDCFFVVTDRCEIADINTKDSKKSTVAGKINFTVELVSDPGSEYSCVIMVNKSVPDYMMKGFINVFNNSFVISKDCNAAAVFIPEVQFVELSNYMDDICLEVSVVISKKESSHLIDE